MVGGKAGAAVDAHRRLHRAQFFAGLDEFGQDFQQVVAFARADFAALGFRQHRLRQFVLQGHAWLRWFFQAACGAKAA